jgi:hypothetical protein
MSGVRNSNWGNGYTLTTLPEFIKSRNPDVKLIKYSNPHQRRNDVAAEQWIRDKLSREKGGGGNDDWWMRDAANNRIFGGAGASKTNQWRINPTLRTTPDARGFRHPQWFARYWHAAPTDSGDWVAPAGSSKGYGLKGGDWDGVFGVDQYITKNHGEGNIDYDNDGSNDDVWSSTVRGWVMEGQKAYRDAWYALEPKFLFFGNVLHMLGENETIPASFFGTYDGVLVQDITKLYEPRAGDGWGKMMAAYRRALALTKGPKIAMFHSNIGDWKLKYPSVNYSNYRWNRYGLTSCLMDNGYYAVMIEDGPPELDWFDEFDGGELDMVGYLGQAMDPPQTSAWSQGVYRREFYNGLVLVNPKGNGARTVNVGEGWKKIVGRQDPKHNDGQSVTSITLDEQDGIILLRENAMARPQPPQLHSVE